MNIHQYYADLETEDICYESSTQLNLSDTIYKLKNNDNFLHDLTNTLALPTMKNAEQQLSKKICKKKYVKANIEKKGEKYFIKCFVCNSSVKKSKLKDHLIFGGVTCTDCNFVASSCHLFKTISQLKICDHDNYTYVTDITDKIYYWFNIDETDISKNKQSIDNLKLYISKLKTVAYYRPWINGIYKCNDIIRSHELNTAKNLEDLPNEEYENIKLPKNGRYLIMTVPLEECPDCYTKLKINNFEINVHTCLIKNKCEYCKLPIYWVLPPPGGRKSRLKITYQ